MAGIGMLLGQGPSPPSWSHAAFTFLRHPSWFLLSLCWGIVHLFCYEFHTKMISNVKNSVATVEEYRSDDPELDAALQPIRARIARADELLAYGPGVVNSQFLGIRTRFLLSLYVIDAWVSVRSTFPADCDLEFEAPSFNDSM
ncbi:hypothetical protein EXIGLDRAFT_698930 [Exidia glandulosa HHB12029]|uniref:Uncharacterized protein n=1 Tax=Exidia glandulosa HHB12029 TaxID=1314781 RepID=A0A165E1R2_EXIGL|nr:hypothetical protein EXIGLDRAFT_698930 [Exidia glandulosa HHB12029]